MGNRVGTKRSDRRWKDNEGTIWASKYECLVYEGLLLHGVHVEKCEKGEGHSFRYTESKANLRCLECQSTNCVQDRTYTPDLLVVPGNGETPYYLETKGFFPAKSRNLLRNFNKSRSDINLRFVTSTDAWVTKGKTKLSDYFQRYLKTVPFHVWNHNLKNPGVPLPEEWL